MTPKARFQSTVASLIDARAAVVVALHGGRSERHAREYAIQRFYLVAVRSFEAFLEDQLHGPATKRVKWASRNLNGVRVRCSNRLLEHRAEIVKEIILGGKEYADYLPYERTEKMSELLLIGGRPFNLLSGSDRETLRRCQRVRNYIAHRSDFALSKFVSAYKNVKPLRVSKPTPIHYLDDQIRAGISMFEHDLSQMAAISNFLS
jgi:hypothetical protein